MLRENAVEVRSLTKCYALYRKASDRVREALNPFRRSYHEDFFALRNITFDIRKGESIGVIGSNGSGKSTLLKILVGVLNASSGFVEVDGRISALLELGAGFNPDYSGIENIYFSGTIMGFSREEMDKRLSDIISFADIGDFVYQPVKTYSSGMFVRLAFATQIYSNPDILIVDEALSVGDMRFQQKCYRAMEKLMKDKTVILVTHDPGAVLRFCKRVIWLEKGQIRFDGAPDVALKKYESYLIKSAINENYKRNDFEFEESDKQAQTEQQQKHITPLLNGLQAQGNGEAHITACELAHKADGKATKIVYASEEVIFRMRVQFEKRISRPMVGMTVRDRLGNVIIGINSDTLSIDLPAGEGTMDYEIGFTMPPLNHGEYTISPAVASGMQDDHIQLCWINDAWVFDVPKHLCDIPGINYISQGCIDVFRVMGSEGDD